MAVLESGVGAVATASGHAAQFMALTSVCEPGHNFVSMMHLYGGTFNQFWVYFEKLDILSRFVKGSGPEKIRDAIDEKPRLVYVETSGNPQFNVPDLKRTSEVCHEAGLPLIVDNTFGMGGYLCKPIELGADIVTSSVMEWIGGHGTSMGMVIIDGGHCDWSASGKLPCMSVSIPEFILRFNKGYRTEPADGYHDMRFRETCGYKALSAKVQMDAMCDLGPGMIPSNAWLFVQGLKALALHAERHVYNTLALAQGPKHIRA